MATGTGTRAGTGAGRAARRPLSPHLQIYKPLINMTMSILHRMTGAALYVGTLLLAWWLVAIASGPKPYQIVSGFFASLPGRVVLFGYTWALLHHALGGIRHLIWDTGRGLSLPMVKLLSWATILLSGTLTVLLWLGGAYARGYLGM